MSRRSQAAAAAAVAAVANEEPEVAAPAALPIALATAVALLQHARHVGAIAGHLASNAISDFTDVAGGGPRFQIETAEGTVELPREMAALEVQGVLLDVRDAAHARVRELLEAKPDALTTGSVQLQVELFSEEVMEGEDQAWEAKVVKKNTSADGPTR